MCMLQENFCMQCRGAVEWTVWVLCVQALYDMPLGYHRKIVIGFTLNGDYFVDTEKDCLLIDHYNIRPVSFCA